MDGYSANPPIVVRPRRLRGLRLVAFVAGALVELFGVFLLEREGVLGPFVIMLVGFWITVFALGGRWSSTAAAPQGTAGKRRVGPSGTGKV